MGDDETPTFPASGRPADDVIAAVRGGRTDDADWRTGRTFSLVYNPVDPATVEARLTKAGFAEADVRWNEFGWAATARA